MLQPARNVQYAQVIDDDHIVLVTKDTLNNKLILEVQKPWNDF